MFRIILTMLLFFGTVFGSAGAAWAQEEAFSPETAMQAVLTAADIIATTPEKGPDGWTETIARSAREGAGLASAPLEHLHFFVFECPAGDKGEFRPVVASPEVEGPAPEAWPDFPGPGDDYPFRKICASASPHGAWVEYLWPDPSNEDEPARQVTFIITIRNRDGRVYTVAAGLWDREGSQDLQELNEKLR